MHISSEKRPAFRNSYIIVPTNPPKFRNYSKLEQVKDSKRSDNTSIKVPIQILDYYQ